MIIQHPPVIRTMTELVRIYGSIGVYTKTKALVLEMTGEWHEREEITAETSMFAGSDDPTDVPQHEDS